MHDERRFHARIPVSWPVRVWIDSGSIIGHAEDVSPHGLCIAVPPTVGMKPGRSFSIDVLTDDIGRVSVVGEVRHVAGRRVGLETTRPVPLAAVEKLLTGAG